MNTSLPTYEITIRGHLDARWESWFDSFTITPTYTADNEAITVLTGSVADQAALYGIVARLRNLGVELVSIRPLPNGTKR
ncbi:MAG: hypothetical protein P8183_20205 [Anaerolineae bacterium]